MINFHNAKFIKSAPDASKSLFDYDHVVFIGRSNVGKSSLINSICENSSLAFISKDPGQTKLLNHYLIDNKFYIIDAPGYGYRKLGKKDDFDIMMDSYFTNHRRLKLVLWLLDSRHDLSQDDKNFYEFTKKLNLPVLVILTKKDKLNQKDKALASKRMKELGIEKYLFVSSLKKEGLDEVKKEISKALS